jgi:hypothetical protein
MKEPTFSDWFRVLALHAFGIPMCPEDRALVDRELTRRQSKALCRAFMDSWASRSNCCENVNAASGPGPGKGFKNRAESLDRILEAIRDELLRLDPDWTPSRVPFEKLDGGLLDSEI